ncbi:hypothetical protein OG225_11790 [Nocardia sp. NBC_01377]|uniref:hypothetical protein n=1 Tax=Nocardia sp. NBC_01377 TaxID=2903595 RepID=UPI003243691F
MNSRTYLFALVDGGGTVPPELGMVRRLVERGHRVTVLADESMASDVHATGATYRAWRAAPNSASCRPEDVRYRDWECANPFELFRMLLDQQFAGPAPGYAQDMTEALDAVNPDLAVCSFFAIGAMVAAQARGVPFDVPFRTRTCSRYRECRPRASACVPRMDRSPGCAIWPSGRWCSGSGTRVCRN